MSRILIVEGEPAILCGLRDNLEFESHQVLTAVGGLRLVGRGGCSHQESVPGSADTFYEWPVTQAVSLTRPNFPRPDSRYVFPYSDSFSNAGGAGPLQR